nr:uncharacterized protein LOC111984206 isoform X2 [Quercus suber]
MAEILSTPISPILLLARLRQYCELRFVKMYWQCMRRRRKRHHCQNGIWNGMVRKDLQPSKLLGFGKHGRILFKTIAELVIVYHKKRKFSSHLLRKLRFFPNFREKHPFDPVENVTRREFLCGKKTDLLHMSSDDRKRFLNAVIDLKF